MEYRYIMFHNTPVNLIETHISYHPLIFMGCKIFFLVDLIVLLSDPKSKSEQNQLSRMEGENEAETTSQSYVIFIRFVKLGAL